MQISVPWSINDRLALEMSGGFRGRQGGIQVGMSGAKAVSTLVPFLFARLLHVLEMVLCVFLCVFFAMQNLLGTYLINLVSS